MESLSEKSAYAIIDSPKYDNVEDVNLLNLLSNILGFPDIQTVEKYVKSALEMEDREIFLGYKPGAEDARVDGAIPKEYRIHAGISNWKRKYKDNFKNIYALRAIKDLHVGVVVVIATENADYNILVTLLRKYPEYLTVVDLCIKPENTSIIKFIITLYNDLNLALNIKHIFDFFISTMIEEEVKLVLKYVDFNTGISTSLFMIENIDVISGLDKTYTKEFLTKLFDSNEGLYDDVQKILLECPFTLGEGFLSYHTLTALEDLGLSVFPEHGDKIDKAEILSHYIDNRDNKMVEILLDKYNIEPTNEDINTASSVDNYDLAKRLLDIYNNNDGDIVMLVDTFVEYYNLPGLKWLVNEMNIDLTEDRYSYLYMANTSKEILRFLFDSGVILTDDSLLELFSERYMEPLLDLIDTDIITKDEIKERLVKYLGDTISEGEWNYKWELIEKGRDNETQGYGRKYDWSDDNEENDEYNGNDEEEGEDR